MIIRPGKRMKDIDDYEDDDDDDDDEDEHKSAINMKKCTTHLCLSLSLFLPRLDLRYCST